MGLFRAPPPGRRATPGRVGGGTSIQLHSPSGVRYLSLCLSLSLVVVVVVVVERELYQTTPYSLSLSVCVCVSYLPCPRPSWPRPSNCYLKLSTPRLPPPALSRSVCFGLFCVVCFRSMSLPRFGNLFFFPSYHLGRRTGLIKASRGGHRTQEEEVEDLVSHHPSSWSVWGGRRQGVC